MSNDDKEHKIVSTEHARPSLSPDQLQKKLIQEITVSKGLPFQILCAAYTLQKTTGQNPTEAQIAESLNIPIADIANQSSILHSLNFVWRYLSEPAREHAISIQDLGKSMIVNWYGTHLELPPESNEEIENNINEFNQTDDVSKKLSLTRWFLNNTNWIAPQMISHGDAIGEFFNSISSV